MDREQDYLDCMVAATTSVAMRIARLDRNKFNQAVMDGHYQCAPDTSPGVRRIFEMPDLIGLYFFSQMTRDDELPRKAGAIACQIVEQVRRKPKAPRVYIARTTAGKSHCDTDVNVDASHLDDSPIESIRIFHVSNTREYIMARLEEEHGRSTLGVT